MQRWFRRRRRDGLNAEILIDQEAVPIKERAGDARGSRDVPLSFDPRRRDYGFREVERLMVRVGAPEPDTHDPMAELEEAGLCF